LNAAALCNFRAEEKSAMRSVSFGLLIFSVALMVPAIAAAPQGSGDKATILALENAWNQAEAHKDAHALDQLLAESLAYTDTDGSFMNKKQFLDSAKNSSTQNMVLINEGEQVQMFGDTAVVTGIFHEKGTEKGRAISRNGRFTDTWVKQSGTWLCVASQSTLMSK
jgi:ketosteroid isomerase-like protein